MRKGKLSLGVGIIMTACLFVGCSTTELEERSFPMLVAVSVEDGRTEFKNSFPKEDKMGALGAKKMDYSHLKVLTFDEDLLETSHAYDGVIEQLIQSEEYPRNTYVCVVEDSEELLELEKNISQDLGTYMEEYLKKYEEKKGKLLTLGDLMDEKLNQSMILYLPYLEVEENLVIWKGYMNTEGKIWQES